MKNKINLNGKNILITGANGMIGYQLTKLLLDNYNCVLTLSDIHGKSRFKWPQENTFYHSVDLRTMKDCYHICQDQHIVFHLAGVKGSPKSALTNPARYFIPMLQFNTNLLEAAKRCSADWILNTSSVGVYAESERFVESDVWKTFPSKNDWYPAWAKRMGELVLDCYRDSDGGKWTSYTSVRPANVYGLYDNFGPDSMVIPSIIKKGHKSRIIRAWGDGTPVRDFINSEDVARGMIHLVENKVNDVVNLGSGQGFKIKQIVDTIAAYYGKKVEWMGDEKNKGDNIRLMDTTLAESYGFKPTKNLKDGIKETIEWYLKNENSSRSKSNTSK